MSESSSSPWGLQHPTEALNLEEIMSEQLANDLQMKENESLLKFTEPAEVIVNERECENDFLLAQMLQLQYDKELSDGVTSVENRSSEKPAGNSNYVMKQSTSKSLSSHATKIPEIELGTNLQIPEESNELLGHAGPAKIVFKEDECENDFLLAQMLQLQFDKQCEDGTTSLKYDASRSDKFSQLENELDSDDSEEYCDANYDNRFQNVSKSGYKKEGGKIITKHDLVISARRNGSRILDLPPDVHVGDDDGMNIHLSNSVYNSLKAFSQRDCKRRQRLHDKCDQATAELGLDAKTRLLLFKLVNDEILERVNGTLSTGKESIVLHADGGTGSDHIVPSECAIKVYKTSLNEFKTREKYIQGDFHFRDQFSNQNPRKTIHLWAEKEMHNLNKMHKVGILCPKVVILKKHVLVMSFLGENNVPARQLKETELTDIELAIAYEDCITTMKKLYCEAHLVHADLSEYNILWHKGHCWFIDVSQSVDRNHPRALEFLFRDCNNICNFFRNRGLSKVMSVSELFKEVCGDSVSDVGPSFLDQVKDFEKNAEVLTFDMSLKEYQFNYCWENSVGET